MLANLRRLIRYRGLIQTLVTRELKARYRGSVLGFFWSFINPLLLAARIHLCLLGRVARISRRGDVEPYSLFLFCGLLPWTWFSSAVLESSQSLITGGNLIKKVLFPAEILPIVSVLANMFHFFFAHCRSWDCFWCSTRARSRWLELVWFPVVVVVQLVLTFGLGLGALGVDGALP